MRQSNLNCHYQLKTMWKRTLNTQLKLQRLFNLSSSPQGSSEDLLSILVINIEITNFVKCHHCIMFYKPSYTCVTFCFSNPFFSWWLCRLSWWLCRLSWWLCRLSWWLCRLSWWLCRLSWWLCRRCIIGMKNYKQSTFKEQLVTLAHIVMDMNNNFTLSEDINGPLLAAVIGMEMLAGLTINSFVLILTACHLKNWKQPTTFFLLNMLVNNLIVVLFTMPLSIITAATGEWIFGRTVNQKESVCYFAACIFIFSILTATESLVLLSFDRFFFIVKAFQYKRYITVKKAVVIASVSWLLAAFLSMLPFFGFGTFEFSFSYGMCVPGWRGQAGYATLSFIVISIFIGSITVTSIWTMCFTRKYLQNVATNLSTTESPVNPYAAQERRVIGLFGMLILVHIFCCAPIALFGMTEIFTDALPPPAYATAFVILLLLTVLIPLVQSFFRRDIRDAIVKCHQTFSSSIKEKISFSQSSSVKTVKPLIATSSF